MESHKGLQLVQKTFHTLNCSSTWEYFKSSGCKCSKTFTFLKCSSIVKDHVRELSFSTWLKVLTQKLHGYPKTRFSKTCFYLEPSNSFLVQRKLARRWPNLGFQKHLRLWQGRFRLHVRRGSSPRVWLGTGTGSLECDHSTKPDRVWTSSQAQDGIVEVFCAGTGVGLWWFLWVPSKSFYPMSLWFQDKEIKYDPIKH